MKIMYGNTVGSHATTSSLIVRLLHHMSAKQGVAMNSPSSVKKIQVSGDEGVGGGEGWGMCVPCAVLM
jgi:hypothetical protein